MELKFSRNVIFESDCFDGDDNIKISCLMHHFQDIASEHAERLGVGYDTLIKKEQAWVMTRIRLMVYGRMHPDQRYTLTTCCRKKKGLTFYRDHYIYDGRGELKAASESHWCVMNFRTRRPEKTDIRLEGEYIEQRPFADDIAKIRCRDLRQAGIYKVISDDLDINRHVNNCRYADIISGFLGRSDIREFVMYFRKEAVLGDEIVLYEQRDTDHTVIEGIRSDGTVIFQSRVQMQK